MTPRDREAKAMGKAKFIDLQVQMFGKRGSPSGRNKLYEFLAENLLEAHASGYAEAREDAAKVCSDLAKTYGEDLKKWSEEADEVLVARQSVADGLAKEIRALLPTGVKDV